MKDADCVEFLQWALPKLELRWPGFRRVRRQVCKRIGRRLRALDLRTLGQYRERLTADADEWAMVDAACRITVSRFYRDKEIFAMLRRKVVPALTAAARAEKRSVRCWSIGCASGEEVNSLKVLWAADIAPEFPEIDFEIIGTDADPAMIYRALKGCFSRGSLKDMPPEWLTKAFVRSEGTYCVDEPFRRDVTFLLQDIREETPPGPFDLVLCRNLAFTYFMPALQRESLDRITSVLRPKGFLVVGARERLPEGEQRYRSVAGCPEIFRRESAA